MRIRVVFDDTKGEFDARKAITVVRHMRPRLAMIGEAAFPIISCISRDEMNEMKDAAGWLSGRY